MKSNKKIIRKILHYLKAYWPFMLASVAFAAVSALLALYLPVLTGNAVDLVVEKGKVDFDALKGILLQMAQAKDFVMEKEGGLDYKVAQGGKNFSGGQRQRLAIARALVKKPAILILDDSTSALDYATDAALRKAIREMPDSPTTFIVSQRTASIMHADQILVLDEGTIAGCGTHEELMAGNAIYQEIYWSQQEGVQE